MLQTSVMIKTFRTPLTALVSMLFYVAAIAQPGGIIETTTGTASLACDTSTSSFVIQGTSSLHDWEMISQSCKGTLQLIRDVQTLDIENIQLKVRVTSLKSGKKIMDRKCYDALKYEVYPDIIYKFKSITNIKSQGDNTYKANLEGTLDIAGVLKTIKIDVEIEKKGSIISIKGAKPVKMSDFDVIPPKALLGTLKTGNEITIIFNLNFVE
jgi:polyisoprenoid-binding protein YceI